MSFPETYFVFILKVLSLRIKLQAKLFLTLKFFHIEQFYFQYYFLQNKFVVKIIHNLTCKVSCDKTLREEKSLQ